MDAEDVGAGFDAVERGGEVRFVVKGGMGGARRRRGGNWEGKGGLTLVVGIQSSDLSFPVAVTLDPGCPAGS